MENTEMEMKESEVNTLKATQRKGLDDVKKQLEEMQLKLGSGVQKKEHRSTQRVLYH